MGNSARKESDFVVDERKSTILKTVVDAYIGDPTPVASKTVHSKTGLDVSPATIRNDMHLLENAGYLTHPHTSSGKIPTDLGYRFFVDNFVPTADQTTSEMSIGIFDKTLHQSEINNVERLLEQTVILLSSLTKHTAVIVKESVGKAKICDVHLSLIDQSRCVVALFFDDSTIQRAVISREQISSHGFDISELNQDQMREFVLSKMKENLESKTVSDLTAMTANLPKDQIASALIEQVVASVVSEVSANPSDATVRIAGVANIANSSIQSREYKDEISSQLLSLIEQQMAVIELMRQSADKSIGARIGTENVYEELFMHSLVLAPFNSKDGDQGTVGIIGPTRMDYSKVFNILNSASICVSKFLDQ